MSIKPSLLIVYDYFYPGYKAGGPIQSLANLSVALEEQNTIYVITNSHDLGFIETYKGIAVNKWNRVTIPGSRRAAMIFYLPKNPGRNVFAQAFDDVKPAVIYFNNIYSRLFFRLPLLTLRRITGNHKIVVCPRGMLQRGALGVKPLKKKIYLAYLRYAGLVDKAFWHATNEEEARDIKKYFPKNKGIAIAPNIPKSPVEDIYYPPKQDGQLKLVFLSLIAEKKNVLLLLELMKDSEQDIVLDIYGPVTDMSYWKQCEAVIHQMPGKVRYKGEVQPAQVQPVLSQYHALILLTKGENFGHALYESLSVGRPIITSYFTPWNDLQEKKAGVNVDINDKNDCLRKLHEFADLDQDEYNNYCKGSHQVALQYYQKLNAEERYRELFG